MTKNTALKEEGQRHRRRWRRRHRVRARLETEDIVMQIGIVICICMKLCGGNEVYPGLGLDEECIIVVVHPNPGGTTLFRESGFALCDPNCRHKVLLLLLLSSEFDRLGDMMILFNVQVHSIVLSVTNNAKYCLES